jgi:hypothetical protein
MVALEDHVCACKLGAVAVDLSHASFAYKLWLGRTLFHNPDELVAKNVLVARHISPCDLYICRADASPHYLDKNFISCW